MPVLAPDINVVLTRRSATATVVLTKFDLNVEIVIACPNLNSGDLSMF